MTPRFLRRLAVLLLFLLAVAAFAGAVWRYGYVQALHQLADRGEADLTLAADRLTGQLQLYQQVAVLSADHPLVTRVVAEGDATGAQALLQGIADKTGAMDVLVVGPTGAVLAAANGVLPDQLVDAPYVRRAMQGVMGEHHGIIEGVNERGYFFAAPVFDPRGGVLGVLVVVANIGRVEAEWRGARPTVFFTDAGGEVFISNRSELLFWRREGGGLRPNEGPVPPFEARQVAGHEVWIEQWSPYVPERALHLARDLPVINMRAEALIDVSPARRLAGLQAAAVAALLLAFGAILTWLLGRRRVLALANARLEGRVAERTVELSEANTALRREVAERVAAEAALTKAQADLVQAGKLSALGQMSAGISHELNQPLMAIQQYADNGALFLERGRVDVAGENLSRISAMAKRAARIIKNLRAFARNEAEPMGRVDIVAVIEAALELTGARLRGDGVALDWVAPDGPVRVRGGEVRLGQVMVNLITNALDAMAGSAPKRLRLSVHQGARVRVEVEDSGPGIEQPEKIFDPFYSTKAVGAGEGMGLGLSISYGLVQSFGGHIRGANTGGGALFTVELDPWVEEERAA